MKPQTDIDRLLGPVDQIQKASYVGVWLLIAALAGVVFAWSCAL